MTILHAPVRSAISRRRFVQRLTFAAGGLLVGGRSRAVADAESPSFSEALAFIESEFQAKTFPGAALVVTRHRKTVLEKYWGTYASREKPEVPCDAAMVNMLYSVSKLLSSTVVVMAHQDGLVDYDAPVSKYIPEFVGGGKDKIIVRHLLTHSAGIPNVPLQAVDTEERWQTAVKTLCAAKVEWEPGSKTQYHGLTGHFLAAEIVRRRCGGQTWENICRQRLFKPLAADSLTFSRPAREVPLAITPQASRPAFIGGSHMAAGHPAGGAVGTVADLLRVLHLHLNKGLWQGKTLIKPDAMREMHTIQYAAEIDAAIRAGKSPKHDPWGLGILIRGPRPATLTHSWFGMGQVKAATIFGHAGISTIIAVADPERDAALVFLTTDAPRPELKAASLRSGVTAKVLAQLA